MLHGENALLRVSVNSVVNIHFFIAATPRYATIRQNLVFLATFIVQLPPSQELTPTVPQTHKKTALIGDASIPLLIKDVGGHALRVADLYGLFLETSNLNLVYPVILSKTLWLRLRRAMKSVVEESSSRRSLWNACLVCFGLRLSKPRHALNGNLERATLALGLCRAFGVTG